MKTFPDYLDDYKTAHGIKNDAGLADFLGITRTYVSQIRKDGKAADELCIAIARDTGHDPAMVMIARNALKERGEKGEIWRDFLAGLAASTPVAAIKDYRKYLLLFQFNNFRQSVMANCQQ